MVQIKIDVEQMKSGRVVIELKVHESEARPITKAESDVAFNLKAIMAMVIAELAHMIPGSSIASGEDVELLKSLENAGFEKGDNEK